MENCETCKYGVERQVEPIIDCGDEDREDRCISPYVDGSGTEYHEWELREHPKRTNFEAWRDALTVDAFVAMAKNRCPCIANKNCNTKYGEDCEPYLRQWAGEYIEDGDNSESV